MEAPREKERALRSFLALARANEANQECWNLLTTAQATMLELLLRGDLVAWARRDPNGSHEKLQRAEWIGTEMLHDNTSDVVEEGWAVEYKRLDIRLSGVTPPIRFCDVQITRPSIRSQFGIHKNSDLSLVPVEVVGNTVGISEARALAILGHGGMPTRLFTGHQGQIQVIPPGQVLGDILMPADNSDMISEKYLRLTEALKSGEIETVVQHRETGQYYRVSRDCWSGDWSGENGYDFGTNEAFVEQPILVDESRMKAWIECANASKTGELRASPIVTDADILARCDELWLEGKGVRDLDRIIPKEPKFRGVKAMTIRDLTNGRYARGGRRSKRTSDMIRDYR